MALIESYSGPPDRFAEIGGHICRTLLTLPRADRQSRIDQFEADLMAWIKRELSRKPDPASVGLVLWPLRVARRMTDAPRDGVGLPARTITEFIAEEMGLGD